MNTRRTTPSTWVPHVRQKPRRRGRIAEPLTQDGADRDCSVGEKGRTNTWRPVRINRNERSLRSLDAITPVGVIKGAVQVDE